MISFLKRPTVQDATGNAQALKEILVLLVLLIAAMLILHSYLGEEKSNQTPVSVVAEKL